MDKSKHAKYIAALCHMEDGVLVPYESKHIVAANKDDAVQKATEWAVATVEFIAKKNLASGDPGWHRYLFQSS